MALESLTVRGFRNIARADLTLASGVNLVYGDNAAGKTSLLEAVYCLARARSFVSVSLDRLVGYDADELLVRADILAAGDRHRLGLSRRRGRTRVRLDGQDARTLSEVAWVLPVQAVNTQSQRLLTDGPQERRGFLNWGVFHVEQSYPGTWRRYERAHRQRNAALKAGDARLARAWEPELVSAAEAVDGSRQAFLEALRPHWQAQVGRWLPGMELAWSYRRGWAGEESLSERLAADRERELGIGHGLSGPQRADLRFLADGGDAASRLSRGQQKLLVVALRLALVRLLVERGGGITPILLIDDLPAELDRGHRAAILRASAGLGAQVLVTCIDRDALSLDLAVPTRVFHVEQGRYTEVV